jgi:hypothetical protein
MIFIVMLESTNQLLERYQSRRPPDVHQVKVLGVSIYGACPKPHLIFHSLLAPNASAPLIVHGIDVHVIWAN